MRNLLSFGILILVCVVVPYNSAKIVNVAIPASGTACTKAVTFPMKKLTGMEFWTIHVFGVPILGSKTAKNSGKMQFAASLLAELLDNDNDGCADDPNVLAHLLKKDAGMDVGDPATSKTLFYMGMDDSFDETALMKKGYVSGQTCSLFESFPKFAGLNSGILNFDATQEEWLHFINSYGHQRAYPKIFGTTYTANSALTNAMDIARGGKLKTTPGAKSGYPTTAWYTYADQSCNYGCQAIEYLWWGYAAYTNITATSATVPDFYNEFKFLNAKDFKAKDVKLAKLFKDSEAKTAVYRLPTKPADGTYTGCKICKGGKNHGGN